MSIEIKEILTQSILTKQSLLEDDKLIAVMEGTPFYDVNSIQELGKTYPGILPIIETWFESYKGAGKLKASGFSGAKKAKSVLKIAINSYDAEQDKVDK